MRDDLARLIDRLARLADPPALPTLLAATAAAGFGVGLLQLLVAVLSGNCEI